jgi:ABC-2 type transport system permease protein
MLNRQVIKGLSGGSRVKFLTAAYYEMLKNSRDIKMSAILLVFPIITIYILGNAIGNFYTDDVTNKIPVGYVNQDTEVIGEQFDQFIHHEDITRWVDVHEFSSKDEASTALEKGQLDGLIYLPDKLSDQVMTNSKSSIIIDGARNVEMIESIVSGFVQSHNSQNAVVAVTGSLSEQAGLTSGGVIERIHYTKNKEMPSMIDYYSVLTLLQMLIIGAIFGVNIINKSANSDLHVRFQSLPVNRWGLHLGQVVGSVVYLFITSIVVLLFTKYIYQANWDGNMLIIAMTMLVYCAIAVGMGLLIGMFVRGIPTALMIVLLLMTFFATVSGAISPVSAGGMIALLSPNYHANMLIFGTIYGYASEVMVESALWLGGFLLIIYGVSAFCMGRLKHDHI